MVSFTRGTLNGTRALSTNNFTLCERRLITKVDGNLKLMWNYTLEGEFFNVGWAFLDMLYNTDPITQACYRSMKEVGVNVWSNIQLLDPRTFIDNFVFSFGKIFDSIRDMILFFNQDQRGEYHVPYDAGYGLGTAIYLLFRPK
jgi:hypothetical protein